MADPTYLEEQFGLHGKVAVVTGASRGLGRSMAIALARAGAKLTLVGRQANLDETAARIREAGGEAMQVVCDQTTPAGVEAIVSGCLERWGHVDVLVNNAGTFRRKPALEWTAAEWDEVVVRGSTESREFIAFWVKDDRVLAGMNVNIWDVSETIGELIKSRRPVDAGALADPDSDLATL